MKRGLFDLGKYFLKMVVWKTVILCGYFYWEQMFKTVSIQL
jgi:hypothetical protein